MKRPFPDENALLIRPDYTKCSSFVFLGLNKKNTSLSAFQRLSKLPTGLA